MIYSILNFKFEILNERVNNFLASVKNLFKKPIILVLLLIIILLSVFAFFFTKQTGFGNKEKFGPLTYPTSQNTSQVATTQTIVKFLLPNNFNLPSEIPVYRFSLVTEDENRTLFDKALGLLGASSSAQVVGQNNEKSYMLNADNFYFVGDLSTGSFSFTGLGPKISDNTNEEKIKSDVWKILESLGATKDIINTPEITYFTGAGGEPGVAKAFAAADIYSLTYRPSFNNVPLFGLGSVGKQVWIIVDLKQKIISRFDFHLRKIDSSASDKYQLLSLNDLEKLLLSKLIILTMTDEEGNKLPSYTTSSLAELTVFKISLAYYVLSEKQELLQPIFIIDGQGTLDDGRNAIINGYVPAAKNIQASP